MTTVAIDIQPQFRFTCMAANANHFLHQPENMVKELNRQASIADKRILVENVNIDPESICAAVVKRNGIMFAREGGYFSQCAGGCRGANLLDGLPASADYDHVIELGGENGFGACFHDDNEARSTGLIEWLYAEKQILSLSAVWQRKKQSAVPPNNYCGTTTACTLSSILPHAMAMHLKVPFRLSIKCVNPVSLLSATPKRFPNKCSVMLTKLGLKCRNLLLSLPAARVFQVAFSGLFF